MTNRVRLLLCTSLMISLSGAALRAQQSTPTAPPRPPAKALLPSATAAPASPAVVPPAPALAAAVAQTPQTPPTPPTAQTPRTPEAPPAPEALAWAMADDPGTFSFFSDGGNYLGVQTEEVTRENMNRYGVREPRGVAVARVLKDSPAERAGLKENDVIVRFEGEAVTGTRKLNRLIGEAAPEQIVRLIISRGGPEREISVTLGKRRGSGTLFEGTLAPSADEMRRQGEGVRRQSEELQRQGEELRRQSEGMRRQGEEARRKVEELRRNQPGLFSMSFGARRRLGISTSELTEQLSDYFGVEGRRGGVLVTSVGENSAAAKAGLKAGDIITAVDGERVVQSGDLSRAIERKNEGDVTLTVVRDKKQRSLKATPERTQSPGFDFTPNVWAGPRALTIVPSHTPIAPRVMVTPPRVRVTPRLRARPFVL